MLAALPIWLRSVWRTVEERRRAAQNTRLYSAEQFDGQNHLGRRRPSIPWYRKLMGDRAYSYVRINDAATDQEWVVADHLFPEAIVSRTPKPRQ
jgi:hypothetical protein